MKADPDQQQRADHAEQTGVELGGFEKAGEGSDSSGTIVGRGGLWSSPLKTSCDSALMNVPSPLAGEGSAGIRPGTFG